MCFNTAIYFFCSTHSKKYIPLWVKDVLCAKETNLKSKCGIALFVNKINTCKRSKIQWLEKGEEHFSDHERRQWECFIYTGWPARWNTWCCCATSQHPANRTKMAQGESSTRVYSGYLDSHECNMCIFFCGTKAGCLHLTNHRGNLCFHFESIWSWKESPVKVIIPNFRRVPCRNFRENIRIITLDNTVKKQRCFSVDVCKIQFWQYISDNPSW